MAFLKQSTGYVFWHINQFFSSRALVVMASAVASHTCTLDKKLGDIVNGGWVLSLYSSNS